MLNFIDFTECVKQEFLRYFRNEKINGKLEIRTVGDKYIGLLFVREGRDAIPAINLQEFYDKYKKGESIREIYGEILQVLNDFDEYFDKDVFLNYENVKKTLYIEVSSMYAIRDKLGKIPYKQIEDVAITYHFFIQRGNDINSVLISNSMLKRYGITEKQLHHDALVNSARILPYKFEKLQSDDVELKDTLFVTNKCGVNGSAAVFYPGIMQRIAKQINGSYYLLLAYKDGVFVTRDTGKVNPATLIEKMTHVFKGNSDDEIILPLYHYDFETKMFESAKKYCEKCKRS